MLLLDSKPEPLRTAFVDSICSLARTVAAWPGPAKTRDQIVAYVADRHACTSPEVETALREAGVSLR